MVGRRNPIALLQCNTYVRTFESGRSPVHVCIDPGSRTAVRTVVNRHYVEVLHPLVEQGRRTGQLDADADVDAFVALLMLVLPHLVIAARNPELDALLGLGRGRVADGERAVDRLVEAFRTGFAPRPASSARPRRRVGSTRTGRS